MTKNFEIPSICDELPASRASEEMLETLFLRRSTTAACMMEPGPDEQALSTILRIGARVPDHRRVTPFRFIIFKGDGRQRFGTVLKSAFVKAEPGAEPGRVEIEGDRFMRAPVVIAVISAVNKEHKTPEWEQILSAGAVCQNLLLAASASGFAAQWLTEWYAFDANVDEGLGLKKDERIAGYIYIGTAKENPKERGRPDIDAITCYY